MSVPLVSVVMPAHNAASYLLDAVESVLVQSFRDFELIVIDDASTDETTSILEGIRDSRILVLRNDSKAGVARSLNLGIERSTGRYVARMDADDICIRTRLERQVDFMEKHAELGICGAWVQRFGEGRAFRLRFPVGEECNRSYVLLGNPLAHPSVMFRREGLLSEGLKYDERLTAGQDYDLWVRAAGRLRMNNIPEVLLKWRHNTMGVTSGRFSESDKTARQLQSAQLTKLGIDFSEDDLNLHRLVGNGGGVAGREELSRARVWLSKLISVNEAGGPYPPAGLSEACAFAWFRCCMNSSGLGASALGCLRSFPSASLYRPSWDEWARFAIRHLILRVKTMQGRPSDLAAVGTTD